MTTTHPERRYWVHVVVDGVEFICSTEDVLTAAATLRAALDEANAQIPKG